MTIVNMPSRRGTGIGRGRPEENAVLLDEFWSLHTIMDTMEITQRRTHGQAVDSPVKESSEEEEEDKLPKLLRC